MSIPDNLVGRTVRTRTAIGIIEAVVVADARIVGQYVRGVATRNIWIDTDRGEVQIWPADILEVR